MLSQCSKVSQSLRLFNPIIVGLANTFEIFSLKKKRKISKTSGDIKGGSAS